MQLFGCAICLWVMSALKMSPQHLICALWRFKLHSFAIMVWRYKSASVFLPPGKFFANHSVANNSATVFSQRHSDPILAGIDSNVALQILRIIVTSILTAGRRTAWDLVLSFAGTNRELHKNLNIFHNTSMQSKKYTKIPYLGAIWVCLLVSALISTCSSTASSSDLWEDGDTVIVEGRYLSPKNSKKVH